MPTVAESVLEFGNDTSQTVSFAVAPPATDVVLLCAQKDQDNNNTDYTFPAGFTTFPYQEENGHIGQQVAWAFGDGSTTDFTVTGSRFDATITFGVRVTDVDQTTPIDDDAQATIAASSSFTPPSVTSSTTDAISIIFVGVDSDVIQTNSSGYTQIQNRDSGAIHARVLTRAITSVGVEAPGAMTADGPDEWAGNTILVQGPTGAPADTILPQMMQHYYGGG